MENKNNLSIYLKETAARRDASGRNLANVPNESLLNYNSRMCFISQLVQKWPSITRKENLKYIIIARKE